MTTSDRTRKLLWGYSGNRCALCRCLLSADPTSHDPAAVLGDECHVVARQPGGPRAREIPEAEIDRESNLVLLCRTDHKRVDDQPGYFTSDRLRSIKVAHESWVRSTLDVTPPPSFEARLQPADPNTSRLAWVATGEALFDIVCGAMAYDFGHDELSDEAEVELIADFLQTLQEYGEMGDDMEAGERVRSRFSLSTEIKALGQVGFWIYAAQVPRVLEANGKPLHWPVATVRVKRLSDLLLQFAKEAEAEEAKTAAGPPQSPVAI